MGASGRSLAMGIAAATVVAALAVAGAADAQQVNLRFAHNLAPTEPFNVAAERFAANVGKSSNGQIRVTVFPGEQLGPNKEMLELVKQGGNIITLTDAGYIGDFVPDFGILQGPYLMKDPADFAKLLRSPLYADLVAKAKAKGLMPLAFNWYIGSRHVVSNRELRTVQDFRGLSIRVPPIPMYVKTFEALGARPVTLQWSEVYTGLSQNVVDAAEAPLPTIFGNRLQEVRKHVSLTGHFAAFLGITMNAGVFDRMSEAHRAILLKEAADSGEFLIRSTIEKERSVRADLEKQGVKVVDLADVAAFQEATASVYGGFPSWSPGLRDKVQAILAAP
ncbi:MAG: C4-dicarboxylate TRAP transporter substrate-binding protein [Alphaproteobacteria bacterium]|nr:C4-dicarboxylate TRAP transporter substrate-binding protein [Alphaproteobacteria bacterium]